MLKKYKIVYFFIFIAFQVSGQRPPFENEILAFEKSDSLTMPPINANLFVGSSSIRLWSTLQADFKGFSVINRGFGGSNLLDLEHNLDRIVVKYKPAKIFIYAGENDISGGANAEETFQRFRKVFIELKTKLPEVPIVFISIKPSIARIEQLPIQKECNLLIKKYLQKNKNAKYVNIENKMMKNGVPKPIFLKDNLHMNLDGYKIWAKKIRKYLAK